jgi:hypothetical protein
MNGHKIIICENWMSIQKITYYIFIMISKVRGDSPVKAHFKCLALFQKSTSYQNNDCKKFLSCLVNTNPRACNIATLQICNV